MILPYASSLQSLKICGLWNGVMTTDWTLFREFRQLTSVDFVVLRFDKPQEFCAALNCLNLRHLGFHSCQFSADFMENLASLKSLTHLRSFRFHSDSDDVYKVFPAMSKLTSLDICNPDDFEDLTVLTSLKTLQISKAAPVDFDMSHVFRCMPNLESLDMTYGYHSTFPSYCLSHLKKLRSIHFESFALDGDIFYTLSQLSGVTYLNLLDCSLEFIQWSEMNGLTNLERLELLDVGSVTDQMDALMEGKLSKLRYLKMDMEDVDTSDDDSDVTMDDDNDAAYEQWRSLHQRLPSLRQCFIEHPVNEEANYP